MILAQILKHYKDECLFDKKKPLTPQPFCSMIQKKEKMEKKLMQTYLYDFYGDLLNEHQRSLYGDFVLNDLSLSEIAQEEGISRQGVHDLVKRCDRILEGYEQKLHLLERFLRMKAQIERIRTLAKGDRHEKEADVMAEIAAISDEILEEL